MTVDRQRDKYFPVELKEGDKYIHTATQFENRAYGWSSTRDKLGFWLLNPSVEYLSGGPTKTEFLCHRDTTPVAAPIVFNYWRSSHYGGAFVEVGKGEAWTKVVGPFLLYVNSGGDAATSRRPMRGRGRSGRRPSGPTTGWRAWTTRGGRSARQWQGAWPWWIRTPPRRRCPIC
jgi:hypothetical protein